MTVEPTTSSRMVSAHILSAEMFMSKFNLKDVSMLAEQGGTLCRNKVSWHITIDSRHCQVDDAKMNVQF